MGTAPFWMLALLTEELSSGRQFLIVPIGVSGVTRPWSYGFSYGVSWLSFIMIASSTVLLICDRESEEIFYKEKIVDDEDEEEEEEEA